MSDDHKIPIHIATKIPTLRLLGLNRKTLPLPELVELSMQAKF